jgi:hypothetical protein
METFDLIGFVRSTVGPMARYTFPYVASVTGIVDTEHGEHVGSGFRCRLRGRNCLVTANHVAERASSYGLGLGMSRQGASPFRLPSIPHLADSKTDLAIYVLDDMSEGAVLHYWPEDHMDSTIETRTKDYLFVHGYPGNLSRFLFGGLQLRSMPYGVMERDDDLPSGISRFEFAMDYDPLNMQLETGGSIELVEPPGLSGSPVWRIGAAGHRPDEWAPERALLVGVVTRWEKDKKVLLATEARALVELAGSAGWSP